MDANGFQHPKVPTGYAITAVLTAEELRTREYGWLISTMLQHWVTWHKSQTNVEATLNVMGATAAGDAGFQYKIELRDGARHANIHTAIYFNSSQPAITSAIKGQLTSLGESTPERILFVCNSDPNYVANDTITAQPRALSVTVRDRDDYDRLANALDKLAVLLRPRPGGPWLPGRPAARPTGRPPARSGRCGPGRAARRHHHGRV